MKSNHSGIWCSLIWEYPNNETAMCGDISLLPLEPVVQEPLLPLPGQLFYIEFNFVSWHCQSEIRDARCLAGSRSKAEFISGSGFMQMSARVAPWNEAPADESEGCPCALVIIGNKAQKTPQASLRVAANHSRTPKSPCGYFWVFEDKKKWVCFQSRIWRISLHSVWVDSRDLIQLVTCSGQAGL